MATVNLGSIKFNWKGTYAGATAYKVDDVVSYNGSSYISIQAGTGNLPTDTAYWEQMSSAGTDGTDLTTTLTTQGDIVYRNASGLARLGAGTSGQALLTQGTGANPIWGSAGGIRQVVQTVLPHNSIVTNSNTQTEVTGSETSLTPAGTSSKVLITTCLAGVRKDNNNYGEFDIFRKIGSGGSYAQIERIVHGYLYTGTTLVQTSILHHTYLDSPNTSDEVFYKIRFRMVGTGGTLAINVDSQESSTITLMEVTV